MLFESYSSIYIICCMYVLPLFLSLYIIGHSFIQNHIDTEKLTSSLRIACHHPGGKKSMSPGCRTVYPASDIALRAKSGKSTALVGEKTSMRDVLQSKVS